jgi:hypothetical protein
MSAPILSSMTRIEFSEELALAGIPFKPKNAFLNEFLIVSLIESFSVARSGVTRTPGTWARSWPTT